MQAALTLGKLSTSLCLSCLIYEIGTVRALSLWVVVRIKGVYRKSLTQSSEEEAPSEC